MFVACTSQPVDKHVIHLPVKLIVHLPDLSGLQKAVERSAFFVHETIGRDVFSPQLEHVGNIGLPLLECFSWETEHKVYGYVADAGLPQAADRTHRLCRRMPPVKETQPFVREGLHAHGDTVDRQRAQSPGKLCRHVVGITLHGNLDGCNGTALFPVRPHVPSKRQVIHRFYRMEQPVQALEGQLGRRASTQVDAGQLRSLSAGCGFFIRPQFHLMAHRIHIPFLYRLPLSLPSGRNGGIEAAVDAAAGAERNVYVKSCHDVGNTYIYNMCNAVSPANVLISFKRIGVFSKNFWHFQ